MSQYKINLEIGDRTYLKNIVRERIEHIETLIQTGWDTTGSRALLEETQRLLESIEKMEQCI